LQRVAVPCSILQYDAVLFRVSQCVAVCCFSSNRIHYEFDPGLTSPLCKSETCKSRALSLSVSRLACRTFPMTRMRYCTYLATEDTNLLLVTGFPQHSYGELFSLLLRHLPSKLTSERAPRSIWCVARCPHHPPHHLVASSLGRLCV